MPANRASIEGLELVVGEDVGPVVLDALADQLADIVRVDAAGDALAETPSRSAIGRRVGRRPGTAPSKRAGRLRAESMIWVRIKPGHSTETPMPRGASSTRRPSDSATTPYLVTL